MRLFPAMTVVLFSLFAGFGGRQALAQQPQRAEPASVRLLQTEPRVIELSAAEPAGCAPVATALSLSPDGRWLAVAGDDHQGQIWDLEQMRLVARLDAHTDWVRAAAVHPNGTRLATGGDDHRIYWWTLGADGTASLDRQVADEGRPVLALVFSPDGSRMASAGTDSRVRWYDAREGRLLAQWEAPDRAIHGLAFSPDGAALAAVGTRGNVCAWDSSGKRMLDLSGPGGPLYSVAFSPDGRLLAAAGSRGVIRVWQLTAERATATLPYDLPAQPGDVRTLVFCTGGSLAAAGSANTVWLWDLETRRAAYRLSGHRGTIARLAYHADQGLLISGSFDTTVRLWSWPEPHETQAAREPHNPTTGRLQ